jgi:hypothetical protein
MRKVHTFLYIVIGTYVKQLLWMKEINNNTSKFKHINFIK